VEEDEGYGLSPLERSHLDSFLLGKEQSCFEDEWQILAREIDQTCCQLPQAPVDIQKPPVHSTKGIRSLVTPACQFCLKNGSLRSAAESHSLRDPVTKVLTCPVLRRYVCELCGATGDDAHTRHYCPLNTEAKRAPTAILLKTTKNNATGKRLAK